MQKLKKELDLMKQDAKENKGEMFGLIIVWSAIISIILFTCSPAKADMRFNLNPPTTHNWTIERLDLDKLVRSIAMHETKGCTIGSGASHNNPGGVMTWKTGTRKFKYYNNCEEGYEDMKRIWRTYYKTYPNIALAKKWSGNDRAHSWLRNVNYWYNKQ